MLLFTCVVVSWTLLGHIGCSTLSGNAVYQGCFSVNTPQRPKAHQMYPFTAESCLKLCSGNGHHHAGLYSINYTCYCGKDSRLSKAEDTLCLPCKDDAKLFCGGTLEFVSLYKIEANVVTDNSTTGHHDIESKFKEEPMILLTGYGGIFSYNTSSQILKTVVEVDYHVDDIDYNLHRGEGFAIWEDGLYRFPLFEERVEHDHEVKHISELYRCPTFTVDWVHDKIYLPDCYSHHVAVIDLPTSRMGHYSQEVLIQLSDEGAWAMDMAVDPYKGLLFWTTGATLWSCRLDGRGLTKVIPKFPLNRVSSLFVDLTTERVYFVGLDKHDKNSSNLYFSDYSGSISHPLQFLEYEGGSHILSFGIFNPHIYYIQSTDVNSSVVMTTKLDYNHRPSTIVDIPRIQVKHLRLVHPHLQSPGKTDACTNQGCSHLCLVEAALPRCYCPQYYELEHDNKTCIINPGEEEESLLVKASYGLMLVLMVVLGAGVLMCICDKLWSKLHPTVVRLRMPGASFTGHRGQDGENLI